MSYLNLSFPLSVFPLLLSIAVKCVSSFLWGGVWTSLYECFMNFVFAFLCTFFFSHKDIEPFVKYGNVPCYTIIHEKAILRYSNT